MSLAPGFRLGPYEILGLLGAGGMGEVYRARDTRLGRTVAIKVLPPHLARDERLRQRFEREARVVSSLNHPHICSLFDIGRQDGVDFLVLEHLDGETLAARLARGPLPMQQILRDAAAIADALDKAHRRGVVHRDLKPANIMLTDAGPKLLDFGLASLRDGAASGAADRPSGLSTETGRDPLTVEGTILGTIPYMAPEQLEGKEADARSDIFALGAILFEMATRRRAFAGPTPAALIAAILERDPPPISTLQPATPPGLDRAVARCLAKDREDRWQTARDLVLELNWIAAGGPRAAGGPFPARHGARRERLGWIATTGLLALALAWIALGTPAPRTEAPRTLRLSLMSPTSEGTLFDVAVSPDGRTVAMVVGFTEGSRLWVRPLDSSAARALPGTEGASDPFWSPDSRFLGFFAGGKLLKVPLADGTPRILCDAPLAAGGSWNREGTILFGSLNAGLRRVSSAGSEPVPLDPPEPSGGRAAGQLNPFFLPDGRHFLYLDRGDRPGIMVGSLDSNRRTRLLDGLSEAAYAPPGYLLFVQDGTLISQPFDAGTLHLSGERVPIAEQVTFKDFGDYIFSVSDAGVLAYASESPDSRLVWHDRSGRDLGQAGPPGNYLHIELSPDDSRLAIEVGNPLGEAEDHDIWLMDLALGTTSRFTFDPGFEGSPTWSPDGGRIAFLAQRGKQFGIYLKPANGAGAETLALSTPLPVWPSSFSPDGRSLVFEGPIGAGSLPDLFLLPLAGTQKPVPFETTPTWENYGKVSPDGRWIAHNIGGNVFVESFPAPGGKWQVAEGAGFARWRGDGRELFYGNANGELMAVEVRPGATFRMGAPRTLFRPPVVRLYKNRYPYAVSSDGRRFLINQLDTAHSPVTVVVSWAAGLKR